MSGDDRKKTARRVNPESPWRYLIAEFFNYLLELLEAHATAASPPAILRDAVYTRKQVIRNLKIGAHTLERWKQSGLRSWMGGDRREFFRGEDLLEFMGKVESLAKPYKSPHAKRNAQRKKEGG